MKTVLKIFIGLFLLSSCGGSKDSPSVPNEEAKQLGAFDLVFPDNNLVCTEGDDAGDNEIKNQVTLPPKPAQRQKKL